MAISVYPKLGLAFHAAPLSQQGSMDHIKTRFQKKLYMSYKRLNIRRSSATAAPPPPNNALFFTEAITIGLK